MLSDVQLETISRNIAQLDLSPAARVRVLIAVVAALEPTPTTPAKPTTVHEAPGRPAKAKPKLAARKPKRRRAETQARSRKPEPAPAQATPPAPTRRDAAAVSFLKAALAKGPIPIAQIEGEAKKRGITGPALERAKSELKISSFRPDNGARTREVVLSLSADPSVWTSQPPQIGN
jgi:hypothetical protein